MDTASPLPLTAAPDPDDQPDASELGLTQRLLEVLKAKESAQIVFEDARAEAARCAEDIARLSAEANAIKRELGGSVKKGRRRSGTANPTSAGTSAGGSPSTRFREPMEKTMANGKWRRALEVIKAISVTDPVTDPKEKQSIRAMLRNGWKQGRYERRESGEMTNTGLPICEYRLKS